MRAYSSRRAQNIIEYLLLVTAVVVVLITGILIKGGVFVGGVHSVLDLPKNLLAANSSVINFTGGDSSDDDSPCVPNNDDMSPSTPCGAWIDDGCGGTFMGIWCGPYQCVAKEDGTGGYECR